MNQKVNTHFTDLSKLEPGRFHSWQGKRNRPCLLLAMLMWGNNSILSLLLSNSFVCLNISSVLKNYIRFVGIWIACVYYNWVALPENNSPGSAIIVFHIWHICRISYQYNISYIFCKILSSLSMVSRMSFRYWYQYFQEWVFQYQYFSNCLQRYCKSIPRSDQLSKLWANTGSKQVRLNVCHLDIPWKPGLLLIWRNAWGWGGTRAEWQAEGLLLKRVATGMLHNIWPNFNYLV